MTAKSVNAEPIWQKICQSLRKQLNPDVYSRWIDVIKPGKIESNTLVLSVGNNFYQSWLEEHYLPLINETLSSVSDQKLSIRFEVDQTTLGPNKSSDSATNVSKKQVYSGKGKSRAPTSATMLNPKYVFNAFVVGPSNNFAHASSLAVAQAPGKAYNPLFIHGGVGLGKTHLMQAIGQYALTQSNGRVCYLSCETMMNEYINSLQNRRIYQFRKKYRGADFLLIDDVHFLSNKDSLQEEFFHTFNDLFNARKQIVMTSDRPAAEISGLEKRLVSRFEWGLMTELVPPDFETRMAILRSKQKSFNVILPEDVITFIASHIHSNIRRLESSLIRLTSYASIYQKPITMDIAQEQLQIFIEQEKIEPISITAIQKRVADFYDIRLSDITSKNRSQGITRPRQVAMYLCRTLTTASLPEIGSAFEKTHATVLYAYRLIEKKKTADPLLKQTVTKISKQLNTNIVS